MQGSENFEIINSKELYMFLKTRVCDDDWMICLSVFLLSYLVKLVDWATDFHFVSLSIATAIIV
jgi:hypothetical protein